MNEPDRPTPKPSRCTQFPFSVCIETLAYSFYYNYSNAVGGVNFKGDPLPPPEEFFHDPTKQVQADGHRYAAAMLVGQIPDHAKWCENPMEFVASFEPPTPQETRATQRQRVEKPLRGYEKPVNPDRINAPPAHPAVSVLDTQPHPTTPHENIPGVEAVLKLREERRALYESLCMLRKITYHGRGKSSAATKIEEALAHLALDIHTLRQDARVMALTDGHDAVYLKLGI